MLALLLATSLMSSSSIALQAATARNTEREEDLSALVDTLWTTHPEPFRSHPRAHWDERIAAVRAKIANASDEEFFLELARIVALLEDGHSALIPSMGTLGARSYPIDFEFFADGLYVLAAGPAFSTAVGKRVIAFGSTPIETVLARARDCVGADNDQGAQTMLELMLAFPCVHVGLGTFREASDWAMRVSDGAGNELEVALPSPAPGPPAVFGPRPASWSSAAPSDPPRWMRQPGRPYWCEVLDSPAAMYVRYAAVEQAQDERFGAFCERVFGTIEERGLERLIVDLRGNHGGNNYLTQPLIRGVIRSRVDRPGGVLVLIDGETFSAAQNCASYLERDTWALFAGSPSGGRPNHFGDAETSTLPHSGHMLQCSTVRWQDSDPRDARKWIYPDLPVPLEFGAFRAGADPALDAARAYVVAPIEGYSGILPRSHWSRATQLATWPPR